MAQKEIRHDHIDYSNQKIIDVEITDAKSFSLDGKAI